jgi:hypothetical protein
MRKDSTLPQSTNVGTGFSGNNFPIWQSNIPLREGSAPKRWGNSFPSSYNQARSRSVKEFAGQSGHQAQITTNGFAIKKWGDTRYEDQLFEGELAFTYRSQPNDPAVSVLNIRIVNTIWRDFYNKIAQFVDSQLDKKLGIPGFFSYTELVKLMNTPTRCWSTIPKYIKAIQSDDDTARALQYLNLNNIKKDWNLYGAFVGQMQGGEDAPFYQTSMIRKGIVRELVNIWGPKAKGGNQLWLIKKRIRNPRGEWGPPAIVPWTGMHRPTLDDLSYKDVTGTSAVGEAIYVGTVIWWEDPCPANLPYAVHAGTETPTGYLKGLFRAPLNARIRAILTTRPGIRFNHSL